MNYINVPVPEHLVPDVMALITEKTAAERAAEPRIWTAKDLRKLWAESGPAIREFLAALAALNGSWVTTTDLKPHLTHSTTTTFAGMLGALGRRCKGRHHGMLPFEREWDTDRREYRYRMAPELASVISTL